MAANAIATLAATTSRVPAAAGGKIAGPAEYLTGLQIVPPHTLTADIRNEYQIDSPRESKVTYVFADTTNAVPDIKDGDTLTAGGVAYVVRYVAEWTRDSYGSYLVIALEEVKA